VFNIQGSELIFLLLIALIVLGPEKLPDAVRKFGRAYGEFKKMANGFQGELKGALDDPLRELRDTADAMRKAANFDYSDDPTVAPVVDEPAEPETPAPIVREPGLNFGSANPRPTAATPAAAEPEAPAPIVREPGLNFGSANPRRTTATPAATPIESIIEQTSGDTTE
jgi:sec-independent protein translocase protein TatB